MPRPTRSPTTGRQRRVGSAPSAGRRAGRSAPVIFQLAGTADGARAPRARARDRHRQLAGRRRCRACPPRGWPGRARAATAPCAQTSIAGRRLSPARSPGARRPASDEALVVAVVVRDVAARAQQAAHRPRRARASGASRPGRRWPSRRPRAAPRRSSNRPFASQCARDGIDAVHQRVGVGGVGARCRRSRPALRSTRCRPAATAALARRRSRQRERLVVRAAAGARRRRRRSRAAPRTARCPAWRARPVPRSGRAAPASRPGRRRAGPACSRSSGWMPGQVGVADAPGWRSARGARRRPRRRASCVTVAKVRPQAPASSWRAKQLRRHRRLAVRREVDAPARARSACIQARLCASASRLSTASGSGRSPAQHVPARLRRRRCGAAARCRAGKPLKPVSSSGSSQVVDVVMA